MSDSVFKGELLRELRGKHALTVNELSKKIGCSPGALNRWEREKNAPSSYYWLLLCQTFGVKPSYFINDEAKLSTTDLSQLTMWNLFGEKS